MKVELISHWGNDWTICDAARVSFNKSSNNYTEEQNMKLINYLYICTNDFESCWCSKKGYQVCKKK